MKTPTFTRTVLASLVFGAAALGACGDDDSTSETITPTTTAPEATTTSTPVESPSLVGTWAHPDNGRENTFAADGTYQVSQDGEILAEGSWTATATTVEIIPAAGAIACDQIGTYEWVVEDGTLTLTVVDDECPGRRSGLDGVVRQLVG